MLTAGLLAALTAAANANAEAATRTAGCTAKVMFNTSCPSEAYGYAQVDTWEECCAVCAANSTGCGAWTFMGVEFRVKNGNCHLKTAEDKPTKPIVGKTCGIVAGNGPPTPGPPAPGPAPPPLKPSTPGSQHNIIFLLTDDQDLRLGSMVAMPATRELVMAAGANMSNYFIDTPICCPSRTTFMSGKYVHNNKVSDNQAGGCMRMNTSRVNNPAFWQDSFIRRLRYEHGYTTGVFGKLLNTMSTYGCDGTSPVAVHGLDRAQIMCNVNFYNVNWADYTPGGGGRVFTGSEPENYTTSLVGNYSLNWIRSVVEAGTDHPPFFAFLGPHAPHLPSTPAPWYMDHPVGNTPVPKDVYYGYAGTDKHSFLATEPEINDCDAAKIQAEHAKRLRSLVSVDDIVRDLHAYLSSKPLAAGLTEWDNTYLFYTSDHGYNLGQFRVDSHKTQVYDHTTRVPMLIKGPSIQPGADLAFVTSMADVGPTILELAAGGNNPSAVPGTMDGMSFAPMLTGQGTRPWKDAALVEYLSIRDSDTISDLISEDGSALAREEYISAYGYRTDSVGRPTLPWDARLALHADRESCQDHFHDGPNNTFSAIRIINATTNTNMLYAEFADVNNPLAWDFAPDQLNFFELYDVNTDYYMLKNVYASASAALKQSLHTRLQTAIKCKGSAQCHAVLSHASLGV